MFIFSLTLKQRSLEEQRPNMPKPVKATCVILHLWIWDALDS